MLSNSLFSAKPSRLMSGKQRKRLIRRNPNGSFSVTPLDNQFRAAGHRNKRGRGVDPGQSEQTARCRRGTQSSVSDALLYQTFRSQRAPIAKPKILTRKTNHLPRKEESRSGRSRRPGRRLAPITEQAVKHSIDLHPLRKASSGHA